MRGWLLRHAPWWAMTILWLVPMLLVANLAVSWLSESVRLIVGAALDGQLVKALPAAFYGYFGVLVAAWWIKEARHWREVTPKVLRPSVEDRTAD